MLEYARKGLIGLLTPQANTTAEPEMAILLPPGFACLAARLVSDAPTIEARTPVYLERLGETLDRFANAPLGAYALAYTALAYHLGPEAEDRLADEVETARGIPFITAARALADALTALGARRIALVSPYHDALTERSRAYWTVRSFVVVAVEQLRAEDAAFHPIYAMGSAQAAAGVGRLATSSADAVLILGTGLPSLAAIAGPGGGPPVLSSMLALAWRAVRTVEGRPADLESLRGFLVGEDWRPRLAEQTGAG